MERHRFRCRARKEDRFPQGLERIRNVQLKTPSLRSEGSGNGPF
jgi:hypothetical protein